MEYKARGPIQREHRLWVCESCGREYTREEVGKLEWYGGYRCSRPVGEGVLCGGIVFYKKVED
jgi:hypothetical protein